MKNIFFIFIFFSSICFSQTNFRSISVDSTGTLVNLGYTKIGCINISNLTSSIVYVKFYDKNTIPKRLTDVPVLTFLSNGNTLSENTSEILCGFIFKKGLYLRCTTNPTDTSRAIPATKPIIEIQY